MRLFIPSLFCGAFLATAALAHEREFTVSRDWFLPHQGESEIESRSFWQPRDNFFTQQFEYEYGVTDWFGIEPGIEFTKENGEDFKTEALDLELRFSFLDFGYGRILPALNLEYEHSLRDEDEEESHDHAELKLILSMYFEDGQDITMNLNGGIELGGEHDTESELSLGYIRPLVGDDSPSPGWHHGLRGGAEFLEDLNEYHSSLGPLLVYRATEHLNMLAAYLVGLNERDENFDQLRFLVEWEF